MTKKELIEKVAAETEVSKKEATEIVNAFVNAMASTLAKGDDVDLAGFGKFTVKKRAARTGVNPQTKEKVKIAASKAVGFKASKTLKDSVNK